MATKKDDLQYRVYAQHGDYCDHSHGDQCASRHKAIDFVLCASFAYLQEALEYCEKLNKRGVSAKLRKPLYGPRMRSDWSFYGKDGEVRLSA